MSTTSNDVCRKLCCTGQPCLLTCRYISSLAPSRVLTEVEDISRKLPPPFLAREEVRDALVRKYPQYWKSPELFAGVPYSYKSDIWALGCCLYELTTLRHAFHARDLSTLICKISKGKVGCVTSNYSEELRNLICSLMSKSPSYRPNTIQILHKPFIQDHISSFLKDVTSPTYLKRQESDVFCDYSGEALIKENIYVKGYTDDDGMHSKAIKPNQYARKCCEILPSEFESLQILGDRMKLEDRSRIEPKPSGVKECHCVRRERSEAHVAGHIDSQSRQRRRVCKKLSISEGHQHMISDSESDLKESLMLEESVPQCTLSARERRRQKRIREMSSETEACSYSSHQDILEDPEGHFNPSDEDDTEEPHSQLNDTEGCNESNSCESEELSSKFHRLREDVKENVICINKSEEVQDFVKMLDTTLNDSDSFDCDADKINLANNADESSEDLSCRVMLLEKTLVNEIGKDHAESVLSLVKSGSWEDWDEQQEQACNLLGDQMFSSVSTTLCQLKLCYCCIQE